MKRSTFAFTVAVVPQYGTISSIEPESPRSLLLASSVSAISSLVRTRGPSSLARSRAALFDAIPFPAR